MTRSTQQLGDKPKVVGGSGLDSVETRTDIYCPTALAPELVSAVRNLEKRIERRVWLLINRGSDEDIFDNLSYAIWRKVIDQRHTLPSQPIAILIDSPGGDAESAYRLATIFRRFCGGFDVYVPRYAKSAATLLALGANDIVLGPLAELGPLDVQYTESRRKAHQSALNESQALDRLHAQALEAFDKTMLLLSVRLKLTAEEFDQFIPVSFDFVAKEFRSLFEKVDVVHWTRVSRLLRIGRDYAIRLLQPRYDEETAEAIAQTLVEAYPDHSFVIDDQEARRIKLDVKSPDADMAAIFDELLDSLNGTAITAVGFLEEVTPPEVAKAQDED